MHLDDLHVVRGQEVKQGEIIGKVGRTGIKASQAHLHFELRHNGRHVDPLKFLGRLVISPMQTYRGLRLDYDQRRERRKRRRKR
jgi:murein DD-endopeptidase MepM/ murein hydrolase activator NlpD